MISTSNTQATEKKKLNLFKYVCTVKGFNAIVTTPTTVWIEATKKKSHYLNVSLWYYLAK